MTTYSADEFRFSPELLGLLQPHLLRQSVGVLLDADRVVEAEQLLLDWRFLEARVRQGEIFELIEDLALTASRLRALPAAERRVLNLELLAEALQHDAHFIQRYALRLPHVLFQCLWNSCWWYDSDAAARHLSVPGDDWAAVGGKPWQRSGRRISSIMEDWRAQREERWPGFAWIRAVQPPSIPLGGWGPLVFDAHEGAVWWVGFSPDETQVLSAAADGSVWAWCPKTGRKITEYRGHEDLVSAVAFDRTDTRLLTASWDRTARVWCRATGRVLAVLRGHRGMLTTAVFSSDGSRIVTASVDGSSRVWDAATGELLVEMHARWSRLPELVRLDSARFTSNGCRILASSNDGWIGLWDSETGNAVAVIKCDLEGSPPTCVTSPDGSLFLSYGPSETRVHASTTGEEVARLQLGRAGTGSAAFNPDGSILATALDNGVVKLWCVDTWQQISEFCTAPGSSESVDSIETIHFSGNGTRLVCDSPGSRCSVWDVAEGRLIADLHGCNWVSGPSAFSAFGDMVATVLADGRAGVWDLRKASVAMVSSDRGRVKCISPSAVIRRFVSATQDDKASLVDVATGRSIASLPMAPESLCVAAFSPNGTRALVAVGSSVEVLDAATGRNITSLTGHVDEVNSVDVSRDGGRALTVAGDGTIRLWDIESGVQLQVFGGEEARFWTAALSPDGERIAAWLGGGVLVVFDAVSQREEFRTSLSSPMLSRGVRYADDGATIFVFTHFRAVIGVDSKTGVERIPYMLHPTEVVSASICGTGNELATKTVDGVVRVWRLLDQKQVRSYDVLQSSFDESTGSAGFAYSLRGTDDVLSVVRERDGECLARFRHHGLLSRHPDGRTWIGRGTEIFELMGAAT